MAILKRNDQRKRTRHFDLDAAARHGESSRFALAFAPERLLDTLLAVFFCALNVFILTFGVRGSDAATIAGLAIVLGTVYVCFGVYAAEHYGDMLRQRRRLIAVQAVTSCVFLLAKVFVLLGWPIYLLPIGVFAITLSIAQGQRFSIAWTLLMGTILGFSVGMQGAHLPRSSSTELAGGLGAHLPIAATLTIGTIAGVLALGPRVSRRSKVIRAGLVSGLVFALLIFATEILLRGKGALAREVAEQPKELLLLLGAGLLNGLFTGYFMVEFGLRAVETVFDEVTDLRLMELADLNQPILKKFALEAPGTFHHSQMVGTLAEAAAEAIGANALLCRVGAHFHDIGKMVKPEYYIENMTSGAVTKHEGLTPRMSTMIIVSHVKDGVEMAEELALPSCVIDFIPAHHGTIAVEYFYHQAVKQQEKEGGPPVSKDDFRYPGPMPQSRETAILMVADSVEAISRVLSEPNPSRIEQMVHDVVMRRLNEGQFDECAITLAELKRVEEAMCRVLMGVFHGRIKYPKGATVDRPSQAEVNEPGASATGTGASTGTSTGTSTSTGSGTGAGALGTGDGPRRLEKGDRLVVAPGPSERRPPGPEDTLSRIRIAAIAADGPGTPSRTFGDKTPPPMPAARDAAQAMAKAREAGESGRRLPPVDGDAPAGEASLEPGHGRVEAATPTGDLRRPRSGGRY